MAPASKHPAGVGEAGEDLLVEAFVAEPANMSGGMPSDMLASPQATITREPDSTSERQQSGEHVTSPGHHPKLESSSSERFGKRADGPVRRL